MDMCESAIKSIWNKGIYITLGEKIDVNYYAVRIQKRTFTNWIWLGTMLMMLGATLVMIKRTVRMKNEQQKVNVIYSTGDYNNGDECFFASTQ